MKGSAVSKKSNPSDISPKKLDITPSSGRKSPRKGGKSPKDNLEIDFNRPLSKSGCNF